MRSTSTPRHFALAFLTAVLLLAGAPLRADEPAAPAKPDPAAAKVQRLLKEAGYDYTNKTDTVWDIVKHGNKLGDFKVIGANEGDLLVIFVIVAEKKDIELDLDLAKKMLSLNHELDQVKIGIDNDGDAFVRADVSIRILDEEAFKATVEQVAAAADETYGAMQPYLAQPSPAEDQ